MQQFPNSYKHHQQHIIAKAELTVIFKNINRKANYKGVKKVDGLMHGNESHTHGDNFIAIAKNCNRANNQQKQNNRDEITYIPWVISTADVFSPEAKKLAEESGVRLINGDSFIRMILNVGLDGIEDIKTVS